MDGWLIDGWVDSEESCRSMSQRCHSCIYLKITLSVSVKSVHWSMRYFANRPMNTNTDDWITALHGGQKWDRDWRRSWTRSNKWILMKLREQDVLESLSRRRLRERRPGLPPWKGLGPKPLKRGGSKNKTREGPWRKKDSAMREGNQ